MRFLEFDFDGKKLFIIKHHSVIIKCLKKAYEQKLIKFNSTLFHIDKHLDVMFNKQNINLSTKILRLNEEELNNFINHDLENDNSEFIINLMFSHIIQDCIAIFFDNIGSETKNFDGNFIKGEYATTDKYTFSESDGSTHDIYLHKVQDVHDLFGSHSLLDDTCTHQDTKELFKTTESLILDIDLDYFTYTNNMTYAKNKKDITYQISSKSFQRLINNSKIIIIALEPKYCGSNEDTYEIIDVFNEILFKPRGLDVLSKVKETYLI